MDLAALLLESQSGIVEESYATLERSHVNHYEAAGEEFTRQRLDELFLLVVSAIRDRDLAQVSVFSRRVAEERFNQGFDIGEVQAAFNALEQTILRKEHDAEAVAALARAHARLAASGGVVGTSQGAH